MISTLPRKARKNRLRELAWSMVIPVGSRGGYGRGSHPGISSTTYGYSAALEGHLGLQQAQTFLEQLVAALLLAQMGEQPGQLGAGARIATQAQARLVIIAGLAPQLMTNAQARQGAQQQRVLGMRLEPLLRLLQLLAAVGSPQPPVELHQLRLVALAQRPTQQALGLRLGAAAPQLFGVHRQQAGILLQGAAQQGPGLVQRPGITRSTHLAQPLRPGF